MSSRALCRSSQSSTDVLLLRAGSEIGRVILNASLLFCRISCSHFSRDTPLLGSSHSTHIAGTTCGINYGVATCDVLCSIKVLGGDGRGSWGGVIRGINHVVQDCEEAFQGQPAKCVANLSLGGGLRAAANEAVADAVGAGVVMVVAAGNDADDACQYSPASEPKAVTVGSTTISDGHSWFGNYGPCVDVYAPGSYIVSASASSIDGVRTLSGTSMAAPREFFVRYPPCRRLSSRSCSPVANASTSLLTFRSALPCLPSLLYRRRCRHCRGHRP